MLAADSQQTPRGVARCHNWVRVLVPLVLLLLTAVPVSANLTNPHDASSLVEADSLLGAHEIDRTGFLEEPVMPGGAFWAGRLISNFAGHWIDVDLNLPATMTAYEGDLRVRTMYTIIGRGSLTTPTGTFSIIRRVANETMDSSTIGIPRDGPGGYYLTNVLFTQYFLPTGESIHYNYWSSDFGYPDSHGCLGLSYDDAAFMWDFADFGTVVSIHY